MSLAYTFDDAKAVERHTTQYFEIGGNRAIYSNGWFARTIHRAPWEYQPRATLDKDTWELYDVRFDFSLANDVAAKNPQKLAELQALFLKEAEQHHVLPLDDRFFERAIASMVGRPDLMEGRSSLTLAKGMTGMLENVFINVKNKSKTITAEVEVPAGGANGAILAQGGRFGGWALYVKDGKPAYDYNFLGMQRSSIAATQALAPGKATIRFDFAYDGGGMGKGGTGTLFVDGKQVAQGRIEHTQGMIFSADETADVGIDLGTPVVEAMGAATQRDAHQAQRAGRVTADGHVQPLVFPGPRTVAERTADTRHGPGLRILSPEFPQISDPMRVDRPHIRHMVRRNRVRAHRVIQESHYWKAPLLRAAHWLERVHIDDRKAERSLVRVERNCSWASMPFASS